MNRDIREAVARAIFDAARTFYEQTAITDHDWRNYWSPGGPSAHPSLIAMRADAAFDALAAALKAGNMCMLPDGSFKPLAEIYSLAKFAPFPEAVR